jgi:hypothetical protein
LQTDLRRLLAAHKEQLIFAAMPCRSAPAPKNADALRATIETHALERFLMV